MLELKNIKKYFHSGHQRIVKAVDDVSLSVLRGENLGLVGESGSGKTTLSKIILKLLTPDSGEIFLDGENFTAARGKELKDFRKIVQMVFQDPHSSLDPRFTVRSIVAEGIEKVTDKEEKIRHALSAVQLPANILNRYPHEFSGGERQRIAIARALVMNPSLLILDEAVSSLDVIIQKQILDLLKDIQSNFDVTYLFISHNLKVVKKVCQKIAVMYKGRIVEYASTDEVFHNPLHPYTKELLTASLEYKFIDKGEIFVSSDAIFEEKSKGHFVLSCEP
ncbi:MAG: ABC transporter ATP-binding protein [Candidatus Omnitrophica bacterium]|nr:ABC transporter ATP-binding protein [Candidatus Omnitrophota bacterium]